LIVTCDIEPGSRLTEREVIERLGFGRTPVREALVRLAHDGLVTVRPRSGYQVVPLTEKSIDDLYDVWGVLGPLIVRLGMARMSPEVRLRLESMAASSRATDRRPVTDQLRKARELFGLLAEASQNQRLVEVLNRLSPDLDRAFYLLLDSEFATSWLPKPSAFLEFSRASDPGAAAAGVAKHIANARDGMIAALRARSTNAELGGSARTSRPTRRAR
jgi:DNA-binding GntR family transcriptional regulator